MSKLLVKFQTNWADEMDIEGYKVFTKKDWEETSTKCKARKTSFEIYFGTNESNSYENGAELLDEYSVVNITDAEAAVLEKLFGGEVGDFKDPIDFIEELEEDDED